MTLARLATVSQTGPNRPSEATDQLAGAVVAAAGS